TTVRWPVIWVLPSFLAFGVAFDLELFPLLTIIAVIPSVYFSLRRMWISAALMLPGFADADLDGQSVADRTRRGSGWPAATGARMELRRWVRAVQIWLGFAAVTLVAASVNLCIVADG